jgi:glyoxylase-like metal-dependent hydrolase (beta-lactamase superfamily II)
MKVIPLNEGLYTVNKQKVFTAIQGETEINQAMADKVTLVSIQPFVIEIDQTFILLDAGLGLLKDGQPLIRSHLADNGIDSSQIELILISHLHKDHINGLGRFEDGNYIPYFPEATIYIQRKEMEFALSQQDNPSYIQNNLISLSKSANVVLLDQEEGLINEFIQFKTVGGHTPHHQVFWIRKEGETIFYGGDNLPQYGYLRLPMSFKNDFDGKKALTLRKGWEEEAKAGAWKILFYHDLKRAFTVLEIPLQ